MKKSFVLFGICLLVVGGALIIYQIKNTPTNTVETQKPVVATTIFPLYDITRQIAGDRIVVVPIISGVNSTHTFELTPQIIKKITPAKLLFKIGNGLDDWSDKIKDSLGTSIQIVPMSEGVSLRLFPDKSVDPHFWLTIPHAMTMTQTITKQLVALDPSNKDYYQTNEALYLKKLQAADEELKHTFSTLPKKEFATFHDAWYYFADYYGLKIVATFEEFPGKEPTPDYILDFITSIRKNNITTIFSEPQFSSEAISQVAHDEHLTIDSLNPMDGGGAPTDSYIAIMKENSEKIYRALTEKK